MLLILLITSFVFLCKRNIFVALEALIFSIPLYLVRFSVFEIPTTFLEIMIYILFISWLFQEKELSRTLYKKWHFDDREKSLFLGVFLLICGVGFSTLGSENLRTSLGVFKGFFIDPMLFFLVLVSVTKNQNQLKGIIWSFILSVLSVSAIAFIYFLFGDLTFDGRLKAFYESPNYLAMYIAPGFLLFLGISVFNKKELLAKNVVFLENSFFKFSILLFLGAVIILTKSFGAILAIFLATILVFLKGSGLDYGKNKKKIVFIAVSLTVLVFLLALQKYEYIAQSGERSSLRSRIMIWQSSAEMIKEKPIFGIGPGTFQSEYLALQPKFSPYLEWAVTQPHNSFIAFYLQAGVFGFVGFLLILLWLWRNGSKYPWFMLFFWYFVFHSLVDTLYWKNDLSVIFWFFLGLVIVFSRIKLK